MTRLCSLTIAAAFGVCLASSAAVASPITYTYTPAAPFNTFGHFGTGSTLLAGGNYSCSGGVGECAVNGYFTVAAPLNDPTLTNITDFVLTYSFTDGSTTWTNSGGPCPTPACVTAFNFTNPGGNSGINVETDAGGTIKEWEVNLQAGPYTYYLYTVNIPGSVFDQSNDQIFVSPPSDNVGDAFILNDPGTWSDPTPEPSSLLLLGSGLLVFARLSRRLDRRSTGPVR